MKWPKSGEIVTQGTPGLCRRPSRDSGLPTWISAVPRAPN